MLFFALLLAATVLDGQIHPNTAVTFQTSSADLGDGSDRAIDEVARVLKEHRDWKVRVEVHTDSTGSGAYNKKLSQERANAVKDALVDAGVARRRIEAVGMGEDHPLDTNATAEGRQANRRIEFHVVN